MMSSEESSHPSRSNAPPPKKWKPLTLDGGMSELLQRWRLKGEVPTPEQMVEHGFPLERIRKLNPRLAEDIERVHLK